MEINNGISKEMEIDATVEKIGSIVEENNTIVPDMSQNAELGMITVRSLNSLPADRQKAVLDFFPKINISDEMLILSYGDKVLADMSQVASKFIQSAKGSEEEEAVKKMLLECLDETVKIKERKKGFFARLIEKAGEKYNETVEKYQSLDETLNRLQGILEKQMELMKKNLLETKEYKEVNVKLIHNLEDYLVAGQLALEEAKKKLPELDNMDSSLYNDELNSAKEYINTFEGKLGDLELSRASTYGVIEASKVTHRTSYDNLIVLKKNYTHTITFLRQICALALMNERNKISRNVSETISTGTEQMSLDLARDIKSEALKIAQKSNEGFMDPECVEALLNEVQSCTKEIMDIYENSTANLNASLERIRSAEIEYNKAMNKSSGQNSTSSSFNSSSLRM